MPVPMDVLLEGLLEVEQGYLVPAFVPVHQAVAAYGDMREDEGPERDFRLDGAAGAYPQDVESTVLGLDLAGLEIDVGEGVELGHHDVDVVGADARREHREPLSAAAAGHPHELPRGASGLDLVEQGDEHLHAAGIADEYHVVGKLVGTDVDVEYRTVAVDDKFRFRDSHDFALLLFLSVFPPALCRTQPGCALHHQLVGEDASRREEVRVSPRLWGRRR